MSQLQDILLNSLEKIAEEQGYENKTIVITPITSEGANYSSVIFKAKISAPNHEDLLLFGKVASVAETLRKQIQADKFYETEKFVYEHLIKIYEKLQDKYIPQEERLRFPKFYGCSSEYLKETIVLEDLTTEQGYVMYDRMKTADWDYASNVVQELAKFHALSFAYKHEYPEDFAERRKNWKFELPIPAEQMTSIWLNMAKPAYSVVSDEMKERIRNYIQSHSNEEMIYKIYGPGKREQLVHGDYRASNILHKIENGKISSLIPIDYQTLRLGTPITDLLYFIYSGTDKRFRDQYQDKLFDHYYGTLAKFLSYMGFDPEKIYSRKDFDEDYKDMLPMGLIISIFLLPLVTVAVENAPQVQMEGATIEDFTTTPSEAFKTRFLEVLDEFVGYGIL